MSNVPAWILKNRWYLIVCVSLFLIAFKIVEAFFPEFDFLFIFEVFIFQILLVVMGLLLNSLARAMQSQRQRMKVLDFKHHLSREFLSHTDWDSLVNQIVKIPSTIATVERAGLFVYDLAANQFERVAGWGQPTGANDGMNALRMCKRCIAGKLASDFDLGECKSSPAEDGPNKGGTYCLPILSGDSVFAILQFSTPPGENLSGDQASLFENLRDEIAIALQSGLNRKVFYEMRFSETALAERRSISHYLHDNLGQNLGYLRMKLNSITGKKDQLSTEMIFNEIEHMRTVSEAYYEMIRNMLVSMRPKTTPHLANLLNEHAKKVSERANIEVDLQNLGKPIPVDIELQRAIFYVFEEALYNVEKHAKASKVEVLLEWGTDNLTMRISDDGIGFDPQAVSDDQHFGLEIIRERTSGVNGTVTFSSSDGEGTEVAIRFTNLSSAKLMTT
jgi:signal transduction histidine kinase